MLSYSSIGTQFIDGLIKGHHRSHPLTEIKCRRYQPALGRITLIIESSTLPTIGSSIYPYKTYTTAQRQVLSLESCFITIQRFIDIDAYLGRYTIFVKRECCNLLHAFRSCNPTTCTFREFFYTVSIGTLFVNHHCTICINGIWILSIKVNRQYQFWFCNRGSTYGSIN